MRLSSVIYLTFVTSGVADSSADCETTAGVAHACKSEESQACEDTPIHHTRSNLDIIVFPFVESSANFDGTKLTPTSYCLVSLQCSKPTSQVTGILR